MMRIVWFGNLFGLEIKKKKKKKKTNKKKKKIESFPQFFFFVVLHNERPIRVELKHRTWITQETFSLFRVGIGVQPGCDSRPDQ